ARVLTRQERDLGTRDGGLPARRGCDRRAGTASVDAAVSARTHSGGVRARDGVQRGSLGAALQRARQRSAPSSALSVLVLLLRDREPDHLLRHAAPRVTRTGRAAARSGG